MKLFPTFQVLGILSILIVGQTMQYSFSQNMTDEMKKLLPIPKLEPRTDIGDSDNSNLGTVTREPDAEPATDRIAAQIEFEPHEVLGDQDYNVVSNFALNTMETSELCPTGNCEFELEGGQLNPAFTPGERSVVGKLRIDTGDSTKIMNLLASWQTVEETEGEGETTQYIEGTLGIGQEEFSPDFEYRINGTMTSDGENYLVTLHGER
jgi:hypothetical protein